MGPRLPACKKSTQQKYMHAEIQSTRYVCANLVIKMENT